MLSGSTGGLWGSQRLVPACPVLWVRREHSLVHYVELEQPHSFRSQLIPFPRLTLPPPLRGPSTCGSQHRQDLLTPLLLMLTSPLELLPPNPVRAWEACVGLWKAGGWEGTPAEVPCYACTELLPQEESSACLGLRGGTEHSRPLWPSGYWSC